MKISVITGWQIPGNAEYVNILDDQLKKKLVDSYQDLNIDEFEYAMREYGTHTKDWGKPMSIALIDDVVCSYLGMRTHLSNLEEHGRDKETTPIQIEQEQEVDWSEDWEKVKDAARIGLQELNNMIIVTPIYDWLVRTKRLELTPEDKKGIFKRAYTVYLAQLQDKINQKKGEREDYEDLAALRVETWVQNKRLLSHAANISKVIATKELALCEISAE